MPTLSVNRAGLPSRHNRTGGRLLSAVLLAGVFSFFASAVGLVPPSVWAEPPNGPPTGNPNNPPSSGPFGSPIRTFIPFDEPGVDFYSFEVSDLEVYNLEINTSGATTRIGSGTGNDDVLEIQGVSAGSFRSSQAQDDRVRRAGAGAGDRGCPDGREYPATRWHRAG
jgi:hypothetical protein